MSVKNIVQEYAQKRSQFTTQASTTKQYTALLSLMNEYAKALKTSPISENEIADNLATIVDDVCQENVDLWIIAAQIYPSPKYLSSLCTILEREEQCIWHEGIVDILYDLEDERSIPSLEKALMYEKPSDPNKDLAIKILETLDKIGSIEAKVILQNCLKSSSPQIQKVAKQLLNFEL